jgi:RHS repeat-associated protein
MAMPERKLNIGGYRYAAFGFEQDEEVSGEGNSYSTYFRQYDPRLGRWKSPDPVIHPWESDYVAFRDNPILYVDPSGDDAAAVVQAVGDFLQEVGGAIAEAAKEAWGELNTVEPSANGRVGLIPSYTIIDGTLIYHLAKINTTFNISVKNLLDERYIVTRRPQGIRVGLPRFVTAGFKFNF